MKALRDLISIIKEIVKLVMPDDPVHGFPHIARVLRIVEDLSKGYEGLVDKEVLVIATLLHDIARFSKVRENHAEASARVADSLLNAVGYSDEKRRLVTEAIREHSFTSGIQPSTLEAQILSDADKLDALGAIGIARVFMYSCKEGRDLRESVNHFREKILKLPDLMKTPEGRREAEKRVKIVKVFLNELIEEI